MSTWEAILLGIIQGLTEFLPVSSSGHIELGKYILDVETTDNLLFSIVVHGATALSTIVVFRKDIAQILKGLFNLQWNDEKDFSAKILLSMVPVGVVGVLWEAEIEALFIGNVMLVGFMLLITGLLLSFTYYKKAGSTSVNYPKSLLIGLAQAFAIFPGISRSGSTISTALLLNISREKAARFSFLMVLPPIIGAMLLKVKDYMEVPEVAGGISAIALSAGFIAAFLSGLWACKWMIGIVKKGKLIYFAIYCFIVGTIALAWSFI